MLASRTGWRRSAAWARRASSAERCIEWFGLNWDTISGGPTGQGRRRRSRLAPVLDIRRMTVHDEAWDVVALGGRLDGRPLGGLRIGDLDGRSIRQSGAVVWVLKAMADGPEQQRAVGGILQNERADGQHIGWEQARDALLFLRAALVLPRFQSLPDLRIVDRGRRDELAGARRSIDGVQHELHRRGPCPGGGARWSVQRAEARRKRGQAFMAQGCAS